MNIFNQARYNNNSSRILSDDQLRAMAPSIFAETAAHDRSDRYQFIPTFQVVDALRAEGFMPVSAMESRARKEEKQGFTKHLIRFRRHDGFTNIGELQPEVVLMNSHDGTSSYQLSAGLFRLVCSNGLIVADSEIDTVKCRHSGNVIDNVIEGTYSIIEQVPQTLEVVEKFQALEAPVSVQNALAKAVLSLRYDEGEAPVTPERVNDWRRSADRGNDLWKTMNRIQENMIRGGVRGRNKTGGRMSTRAVNSVGENVRLNKAIWQLTSEVANLLKG